MARIKLPRRIARDTSSGSTIASFGSASVTSPAPADNETTSAKSGSIQDDSQATPANTSIHPLSFENTSDGYISQINDSDGSSGEDETEPNAGVDGIEEMSGEAESQNEDSRDEQKRHLPRRQHRKPPILAPQTLEAYTRCQKRFFAWCTEQKFSDGCWVHMEKIIAYCQDELIAKGHTSGRKRGPTKPYSRVTITAHITALVHLYHEQVWQGLHNYSRPRSSRNLSAFLEASQQSRNDRGGNTSGNRGCSTAFDEQTQDPQIESVPDMSDLTNTMKALYDSTMERINGIENTMSSLKTSSARSNNGIEHNSSSLRASPNNPINDVQDLVTMFDTLWKEMENNSGRCHPQIQELGQVTRRLILSFDSTKSSTINPLQDV
ncbi:hypothetical protein DFS34DRAFT_647205 [Phlyctochytrium arcticum]|nr:hypothetical protein DFS34DRAFT_647205 [Phlyctochytrium arcticum]